MLLEKCLRKRAGQPWVTPETARLRFENESHKERLFVIVFSVLTKFRSLVGIAAAAVLLGGASPAFANASANADIIAPLRAAQAAKQDSAMGNGDEEFLQLFNSWQSREGGKSLVAVSQAKRSNVSVPGLTGATFIATPTTVSIPSRMPVNGVTLTSGYGMRWHPVVGGRRAHKGVDLAAPSGTPIYASADGVVSKAEWFSSYGLYVSLEHGGDIQTRYGHMSRLNAYAGQKVRKGDLIGYVGSTGRSTGPHLHYEVRVAGMAVNPVPYMQSGEFKHAADAATAPAMGGDE